MGEVRLPPGIQEAWGVRDRGTKGPRPGLSLERILDAGIEIATSEGLDAVSMNRVARALDASPMALYRYVTSKYELLTLMSDAAAGRYLPAPKAPEEDWRSALTRWAMTYRAALQEMPWVTRVPVHMQGTPNNTMWLERSLDCLRDTALTWREKMSVALTTTGIVQIYAIFEADIDAWCRQNNSTPDDMMLNWAYVVTQVADPERFRNVRAVVESAEIAADPGEPDDPDEEFLFALNRALDGVASMIKERGE
jgi:AcrR family transcriptional regulator